MAGARVVAGTVSVCKRCGAGLIGSRSMIRYLGPGLDMRPTQLPRCQQDCFAITNFASGEHHRELCAHKGDIQISVCC